MTHRPAIGPLLDGEALERMHACACRILERTGLAVEREDIRGEVLKHEGFRLREGRVCIERERVEQWLQGHRQRTVQGQAPEERAQLSFYASDLNTWIVDRDGETVRPMRRQDVIAGTKLLHMLAPRGVAPNTAGVPTDVPLVLRPLEQFMIGAQYSAAGGATAQVTTIADAQIVREMESVYGRAFHRSVWCPSPLRFAGPEVDILWHFRGEVSSAHVGSMPSMGFTGPCDPIAVFTLSIAECLGGAAVLHALLPGVPVGISPHPEPADPRAGTLAFGTPEWELLDLMHCDVYSYYGMSRAFKMLHTSAALPNAQAQIERASGALLGVLRGCRTFGPIGQLAQDEVWSPAQAMLDLDIVAHADRIGRGVESAPGLELGRLPEAVEEAVRSGLIFAAHGTTASNMHAQYHQPALLGRMMRAQWQAAGTPEAVREGRRQADELITSYGYEPPQDILRDLRAIYRRGCQRLTGCAAEPSVS